MQGVYQVELLDLEYLFCLSYLFVCHIRLFIYAVDFADQLENKIIPALRAGYIVLADRYIFTLVARDAVRKINR